MSEMRYRLIGSTASPYAIKLRALMRYRRIPFDWVIMTKALRKETEQLRPNLIPILQYPDGTFRGETTMLAYDLEAQHAERSVIPQDKAVAFVCNLLEDLADEWAVKPLFLYRWWDAEDQAYVSRWAAEEWSTSKAEIGSAAEIEEFRKRQISRMGILGATAENRPLLQESYRRILAAFEAHVGIGKYLFGSRPSLADFAGSASSAKWRPIRRRCGSCGNGRRSPIIGCGGWTMPRASTAHGLRASRRSANGPRRCFRLRANSICRSSSPMQKPLPKALNGSRFGSGACLTCWPRSSTR